MLSVLNLTCSPSQVQSEFILENERESFIEQVREVIEMADEKGKGMKEGFSQVNLNPLTQKSHLNNKGVNWQV